MQPYDQFYKQIINTISAGHISEAIDRYQAYLKNAQITPIMLHNFAALLGDAGYFAEAIKNCDRAFEMGLDEPETWLIYARALQGCNRVEEAKNTFRRVLSKRPLDYFAQRELAQLIWMTSKDREASLKTIDRSIQEHSSDVALKLIRAQIIGFIGDAGAEFKALEECVDLSGKPDVGWVFYIGAALSAGFYERALEVAERGLGLDNTIHNFREFISRAHLALGAPKEALSHLEKLRTLDSANQYYIALLATTYRMLGDGRYKDYFDYENLVVKSPLKIPSGWKNLDQYCDDLISALDERHQYQTHPFGLSVRNGSQVSSIERMENPALRAFPEAAAGAVAYYLNHVFKTRGNKSALGTLQDQQAKLLAAWSVSLPPGGFHINHVHPQGWLSSACHLRTVKPQNSDSKEGWLKFGEPGIVTKPALSTEHFIEPEGGTMVIFPSFMWHGTVEFGGQANRMTIAADFVRS